MAQLEIATQKPYKYLFDFVIVGETGVGKSCILTQFTDQKFNKSHEATIGIDFGVQMVTIDDEPIKINIWDTAGQETFLSLTKSYIRERAACLIVYDITSSESFTKVKKWVEFVNNNASTEMVVILVGNKLDLQNSRAVTREEAQEYASNHNIDFIEVSAKDSQEQCANVFTRASRQVCEKIKQNALGLTKEAGIRLGPLHKDYRIPNNQMYIKSENVEPRSSYCCIF